MMVLESISQKSSKIHRGEFFIVFKYLAILATQNHDKIHIVYNSEFPSYPIQNVLYNFYLKGESKW